MRRDYSDIIDRERPVSKKHPPMDRMMRAAQFAPFAALTGHDEAVRETARLTQQPVFLTEESLDELNAQLRRAEEQAAQRPMLTMTVYYEDSTKAGGRFETVAGRLKKIDRYREGLVLTDGREIPFFRICDLELEE